jgi:amino acid transporter
MFDFFIWFYFLSVIVVFALVAVTQVFNFRQPFSLHDVKESAFMIFIPPINFFAAIIVISYWVLTVFDWIVNFTQEVRRYRK